jgi:hypothetical protein
LDSLGGHQKGGPRGTKGDCEGTIRGPRVPKGNQKVDQGGPWWGPGGYIRETRVDHRGYQGGP